MASGLIDVVMANSLELKLHELLKQENNFLYNVQTQAWEHRHTCLMQVEHIYL